MRVFGFSLACRRNNAHLLLISLRSTNQQLLLQLHNPHSRLLQILRELPPPVLVGTTDEVVVEEEG